MIDLASLREAVARHGAVVRVVIGELSGSSPREAGASMIVWADGQDGTIGGGALEWEAAARSRAMLGHEKDGEVWRMSLGPTLGQCCGGAVVLVAERWTLAKVTGLAGEVIARPLPGGPTEMPLAVSRALSKARAEGQVVGTRITAGWLIEPVAKPLREVWVWGAGHVGRALVNVIAPLPGLRVTWIDTSKDRFPEAIPAGVVCRSATNPAVFVPEASAGAEHYVMTFSHALDLELCHAILSQGFRALGLIGSQTKWARFRSRLSQLGHPDAQIARIACPIGDPSLGKHPQAIAVGVAARLLSGMSATESAKESAG